METIEFITDTATLCIFDVAALKHRLSDDCDWWSVPNEEIEEVNKGNVAFIGLGNDGKFTIYLLDELADGSDYASFMLNCPSGKVFIGAGEEVTGDGLEPEGIRGGAFLNVQPGPQSLRVRRKSAHELELALSPHATDVVGNSFNEPVRI